MIIPCPLILLEVLFKIDTEIAFSLNIIILIVVVVVVVVIFVFVFVVVFGFVFMVVFIIVFIIFFIIVVVVIFIIIFSFILIVVIVSLNLVVVLDILVVPISVVGAFGSRIAVCRVVVVVFSPLDILHKHINGRDNNYLSPIKCWFVVCDRKVVNALRANKCICVVSVCVIFKVSVAVEYKVDLAFFALYRDIIINLLVR